jgi:hypothetical protein
MMRPATSRPGLLACPLAGLLGLALLTTTCAQPTAPGTDGGSDGATPDLARPPGDSLPRDAVSFFNRNSCPPGWSPLGTAAGRFIVPTIGSVGGGTVAGTPLTSGEDRQHSHTFQTSLTPTTISISGSTSSSGNKNIAASGTVNIDGTTQPTSSGLPYVQLLACRKTSDPLQELPPPPSGMMSFFANITTCPSGWTQVAVTQGRFVVGLPNNATTGLTFGGSALGSLEERNHGHIVRGSLVTGTYSLVLASGNGTGYTRTGTYPFNVASSSIPAELPYLQLLHCQKN